MMKKKKNKICRYTGSNFSSKILERSDNLIKLNLLEDCSKDMQKTLPKDSKVNSKFYSFNVISLFYCVPYEYTNEK